MSNLTHEVHAGLPSSELDGTFTPAGSAGLNADSVSLDGIEVGEAHDDVHEADSVTTRLFQEATATLRGH